MPKIENNEEIGSICFSILMIFGLSIFIILVTAGVFNILKGSNIILDDRTNYDKCVDNANEQFETCKCDGFHCSTSTSNDICYTILNDYLKSCMNRCNSSDVCY